MYFEVKQDIQQEKINTGKNILSIGKWLAHEKCFYKIYSWL